jgi:ADP-ribose pyrophosphatase YjhB (NUDIX family)
LSREIPMKFCSLCGGNITHRLTESDNRPRHICDECGMIHYQNPNVVTGAIITWQDKVLLCRRAIEPRYGFWTVPAGFMENGETTWQGAMRETREEACANIEIDDLYATVNLPHINQVYMLFRARLLDLDFAPGEEILEVKLFDESAIPWDDLAFPVVSETLKLFFDNRRENNFPVRMLDIVRIEEAQTRRLEITLIR